MLPCIRESREGALVDIHVVPGARKEEIFYDEASGRLKVKIAEHAKKGKANRAVLKKLSALFGECELVSGAASRKKTVLVRGKSASEVAGLLN